MNILLLLVTGFICSVLSDESPIVTFSHGGQLRGKNIKFKDGSIDVYLGVRYAKPPTGDLRFKKPEPIDAWKGVKNALLVGNICPQTLILGSPEIIGKSLGDEDCLFLDVWSPPRSKLTEKKAVMVWIHGGGYQIGTGQQTMVPVPYDGDVILVSINYRLGLFGFLNDGSPGSGNFGLWDQRQALIWVQENIEAFGGDPGRVTIFGESAGGASVNCQALSPKNEGLFHRVIQQSGTCLTVWSYASSSQDKSTATNELRDYLNCTRSLYDCFNGLSTSEASAAFNTFTNAGSFQFAPLTVPHQDGDFFRDDILNFEYTGQGRFDYMAGFNGQEGNLFMLTVSAMALHGTNLTLDKDGIPKEYVQAALNSQLACGFLPFGSELCAEYAKSLYKLDEDGIDNQDRAYRISQFGGELFFKADTKVNLDKFVSSGSTKKIYGYYFTENKIYQNGSLLWPVPKWLKKSADHGDELWYIFKPVDLLDEFPDLVKQISGKDLGDHITYNLFEKEVVNQLDKSMKPFSDMMLTLWTNFAKTGNPNKPVKVKGMPEWVPYSGDDGQLMELKSKPQLVKFPDKERVTKLHNTVLALYREYKVKGHQLPTTDGVEVFVWSLEPSIASKLIYGLLAALFILYIVSSNTKQPVSSEKKSKQH